MIFIGLDTKSIQNAIKQLQSAKRQIKQMRLEFFDECCKWFIQRANEYLDIQDVGDYVKWQIERGWSYTITQNNAKITNTAPKAVFVEFGVGEKGDNKPHPNQYNYGNAYEYNIPTNYKYATEMHPNPNTWRFYVQDESDIDLQNGDYEAYPTSNDRLKVITTGSQGALYAYNALMDLKLEYPKIWQRIKQKYWS